MIFARNVMLCAQFAVQRAFNYAPVSSIGRFGIVLADKTLKLSGVSVCVCTSPKNSCYCFCINKSLLPFNCQRRYSYGWKAVVDSSQIGITCYLRVAQIG